MFIKEFGEVYNALEALDKEYIQAILISIKAAEQASQEAKDAQKDIERTIEIQKQTITVLKTFKEKLEKYEHLENIDEVWQETQRFVEELKLFNKEIDHIKHTAGSLEKQLIATEQQMIENKTNYENQIKILSKKTKTAYVLAGGSIGIVLLQFVLNITGIL
jgi:septal ring factor EnvC (AmiA/AmiB activator)